MNRIATACLGILLMSGAALAADKMELKSDADQISYSVGYQVGGDFQRQGWKLNPEVLLQGIRDAVDRAEPRMTQAQMNTILVGLKKRLTADQHRLAKEADAAFLTENAKKEGVVVLPNGVQYRVIRNGSGRQPSLEDSVTIRYRFARADQLSALAAGPDSGPKTYALKKALPGLRDALQLMKEGSIWQIVLPPGPAMGVQGEALETAGVLVYELELISVQSGR